VRGCCWQCLVVSAALPNFILGFKMLAQPKVKQIHGATLGICSVLIAVMADGLVNGRRSVR
jgi:hypothetical protein